MESNHKSYIESISGQLPTTSECDTYRNTVEPFYHDLNTEARGQNSSSITDRELLGIPSAGASANEFHTTAQFPSPPIGGGASAGPLTTGPQTFYSSTTPRSDYCDSLAFSPTAEDARSDACHSSYTFPSFHDPGRPNVRSYPSSLNSFTSWNAPGIGASVNTSPLQPSQQHLHQSADQILLPHNYSYAGDPSGVNYGNPQGHGGARVSLTSNFPNYTPNYNHTNATCPSLQVINYSNSLDDTPGLQSSNFGGTQHGSLGNPDPAFLTPNVPIRPGQCRPRGRSTPPNIQTPRARQRSLSNTSTRTESVLGSRVSKSSWGSTSPIYQDVSGGPQPPAPPSRARSRSISSSTTSINRPRGRRRGELKAKSKENANLVTKNKSACIHCKFSNVGCKRENPNNLVDPCNTCLKKEGRGKFCVLARFSDKFKDRPSTCYTDILHRGRDGEPTPNLVLGDLVDFPSLCAGIDQLSKRNIGNPIVNVLLSKTWYGIDLVKSHECLLHLGRQLHDDGAISQDGILNLKQFIDSKFERSAGWDDCVKGWRGLVDLPLWMDGLDTVKFFLNEMELCDELEIRYLANLCRIIMRQVELTRIDKFQKDFDVITARELRGSHFHRQVGGLTLAYRNRLVDQSSEPARKDLIRAVCENLAVLYLYLQDKIKEKDGSRILGSTEGTPVEDKDGLPLDASREGVSKWMGLGRRNLPVELARLRDSMASEGSWSAEVRDSVL